MAAAPDETEHPSVQFCGDFPDARYESDPDLSDSLLSLPASESGSPELNRFPVTQAHASRDRDHRAEQSAASTTSFEPSSSLSLPPAVVTTTVYRRVRMTREEAYQRAAAVLAAKGIRK
uniref:Uncharacterized protein n=1 Tax=Neobodo designis TaxID=312471 RepID=A0A7S1Q4W0_NEODS